MYRARLVGALTCVGADFMFMNDLFMNDVGEHVPEIGNARKSGTTTSSRQVSSPVCQTSPRSAQCGAATVLRLERRNQHGRTSWKFCLVRAYDDRHGGRRDVLR